MSTQEIDSCCALNLQMRGAPRNPPQLHLSEHHQRFQKNICTDIWIDSGLNIVKAGKNLINTEMKVISSLKFETIEFRVTLPKHHARIRAVERVISSIKNTISKSVTGPHPLTMDNEELFTWEHKVIDKLNNCPLILGTPLGITLTPNCVLQVFRECYWGEINPDAPVQHQLSRWKIILNPFNSLWEQEYNRRGFEM